jgi:hypothetical protein
MNIRLILFTFLGVALSLSTTHNAYSLTDQKRKELKELHEVLNGYKCFENRFVSDDGREFNYGCQRETVYFLELISNTTRYLHDSKEGYEKYLLDTEKETCQRLSNPNEYKKLTPQQQKFFQNYQDKKKVEREIEELKRQKQEWLERSPQEALKQTFK